MKNAQNTSSDGAERALLRPGDTVGDYRVIGWLGSGGMGQVYSGEQPVIGKKVAIKVLDPVLAHQPELVRRFGVEAKAASRIEHTGIINVFSFGECGEGTPYFVMEYLAGNTLGAEMKTHSPLRYSRALPLIVGICEALHAAHLAGVIHRDLKPENIFLVNGRSGPDQIKILDFGVARLFEDGISVGQTRTGIKLGTPLYMAPEQGEGKHVDRRADIYAFGVILFQMFTGQPPFSANSYLEILQAHSCQPPPQPSELATVPPKLEKLILWALEKDPERRPENVKALQIPLAACLKELLSNEEPQAPKALALSETSASANAVDSGEEKALAGVQHGPTSGRAQSERPRGDVPRSVKGHLEGDADDADGRFGETTQRAETPPLRVRSGNQSTSSWLWWGGIIAVIMAIGIGAVFAVFRFKKVKEHNEQARSSGTELQRGHRVGTLSIITHPEGAAVTVQGRTVSQKTPALISGLPVGRPLTITIKKKGFKHRFQKVRIDPAKKALQVKIRLQPAVSSQVGNDGGGSAK